MKFSEFISDIDVDDFRQWFDNKKEKDLIYTTSDVWKYYITKDDKAFPFKVAVRTYLKERNLGQLSDFQSNYDTRHRFCKKFGFKIHEDLIYDSKELESFKKFYTKEVYNKTFFQSFILYCHEVLKGCSAEPYNVRIAISSSDRDAMLILGQRAMISFSRKGKNNILFIMDKSFDLSNLKHKIVYDFQGGDNKQYVEFEYDDWEDIPEEILLHNTIEVRMQYNIIKNKKIAQWNQEATTTNSVLKYLIFQNINVENFLAKNKKTEMHYFDINGIIDLPEKHDENVLQDTLRKLDYLKSELGKTLNVVFPDSDHYSNTKNSYIDIAFSLTQSSDSSALIIMGFFGEDDEDEVFFKLKAESKGEFDSEEIFNINENYALTFSYDEFPQSWEELTEKLRKPVEDIVNSLAEINPSLKSNNIVMQQPLNQILYGPPGTGKTYNTINQAINIANPHFDLNQGRESLIAEYDRLAEAGQIVFTTFHQSMSYEDFIEGIKPVMTEDEGELNYEVQNGIFKEICKAATEISEVKLVDNFDDSWGKLIAIVKEHIADEKLLKIGSWEYGLSTKESLKYSSLNSPSQYTFTITKQNILDTYQNRQARPSGAFQKDMEDVVNYMKANLQLSDYREDSNVNQYKSENKNHVLIIDEINRGNVSQIFGELITLIEEGKRTANSEELQVTLPYSKKKFGVPANLYIIGTMNTADRSVEALDTALRRRFSFVEMMPDLEVLNGKSVNGIILRELLETINKRIEVLLGRDHTIGHSYFINVISVEQLKATFKNNIIPLLQEYFYGDYEKIGMILGNGFFEEPQKFTRSIFADFATQNYPDSGSILNLKVIDDSFDIIKALETLMKKPVHVNG